MIVEIISREGNIALHRNHRLYIIASPFLCSIQSSRPNNAEAHFGSVGYSDIQSNKI
jgi:hypothetical protein